jgi:hypothetical protein
VSGIVYDTGALLAAERRHPDILLLHERLTRESVQPIVPVVVLAQAWRGGPQHNLSKLLKGCRIQVDEERIGRAAGVACATAGTSDVVDAIVVVTAVARGAAIATGDPDDLARLGDALKVKLHLFTI